MEEEEILEAVPDSEQQEICQIDLTLGLLNTVYVPVLQKISILPVSLSDTGTIREDANIATGTKGTGTIKCRNKCRLSRHLIGSCHRRS
jgi:hypothetical protein